MSKFFYLDGYEYTIRFTNMNIPSWIIKRPIAHRGLHNDNSLLPENSIAAFKNAIDHNYPIEVDVHLTADFKVVVFHDSTLERMCNSNLKINEIKSANLGDFHLLGGSQKIPLLEEVFNLVNGQVPLLIEIKDSPLNKKLYSPITKLLSNYQGDVAIQSFNPYILGWFAKNYPNIPRGQLSSAYRDSDKSVLTKYLLKNYLLNFISQPQFIAHNHKDLTSNIVNKFRNKDVPILCWTLKDKNAYDSVRSSCDNIIFERFDPHK